MLTNLTIERLREVLDYDPYTGIFTRRIRQASNALAGTRAGTALERGYIGIMVDKIQYKAHRLAWFFVYEKWPLVGIDHINGIRNDNRIENLREADQSQNIANGKKHRDSTSGLKGVTWNAACKRWMAQIHWRGKHIYLGLFDTKEEAHAAYCAAAKRLHGEYARFE